MKQLNILILCTLVNVVGYVDVLGQIDRKQFYSSTDGLDHESDLFNDVNMTSYELITTNLIFSDKNNLQKLIFTPFKLRDTYQSVLSETKLNIAQKNGISTFGIGFGYDNSSPFGTRGNKLFDKLDVPVETDNEEIDQQVRDSIYIDYLKSLVKGSIRATVGFNVQLFEVLGGDETDLDNDGLVENKFSTKGFDLGLGVNYAYSEEVAFSAGFHFTRKRESADEQLVNEKEELSNYVGFSGSLSVLTFSLVKRSELRQNQYYKESLFWPSIWFGLSFEYQKCQDRQFCADNIESNLVFTPHFNFKITPYSQFRMGFPVRSFQVLNDGNINDSNDVNFGPFLQLRFQLAGL